MYLYFFYLSIILYLYISIFFAYFKVSYQRRVQLRGIRGLCLPLNMPLMKLGMACFCSRWKKLHGGHRYTKIIYPHLLICYAPGADFFLGKTEHFFASDEIIYATPKKKLNTPPCLTYENIYYKNRNKFYWSSQKAYWIYIFHIKSIYFILNFWLLDIDLWKYICILNYLKEFTFRFIVHCIIVHCIINDNKLERKERNSPPSPHAILSSTWFLSWF